MTQDSQYQHILLAVDGSKATNQVLQTGIKIALRNAACLDILQVVQVTQLTDGYSNMALSNEQTYSIVKVTHDRLSDLQAKAKQAGVNEVKVHIRFGNPKRVIAREYPADHPTDLIVLGSNGISGLERIVLGSVTHYVSRMAPCDVMVARTHK